MPAEKGNSYQEPRKDSWIRRATFHLRHGTAELIDRHFPSVTADDLSHWSRNGVLVAQILATRFNLNTDRTWTERLAPAALDTVASLLDAVDGELAKIKNTYGEGDRTDAQNDAIKESLRNISHAAVAHEHGWKIEELLAYGAMATNNLPRTERARNQACGISTGEGGNSLIDWAGTHLGRSALGIIGSTFSDKKVGNVSMQGISDALIMTGNLVNTYDRIRLRQTASHGKLNPYDQALGAERHRVLTLQTGWTVLATLGTYYLLNHSDSEPW